jgi:hypothetical protein
MEPFKKKDHVHIYALHAVVRNRGEQKNQKTEKTRKKSKKLNCEKKPIKPIKILKKPAGSVL